MTTTTLDVNKTTYYCKLCQKDVVFKNAWYEPDLHMLHFHHGVIVTDAVKKYLEHLVETERHMEGGEQ